MTTSQDAVTGFEITEGDRIKIARERRGGMSQTELALASRVSRGTIQNYEAGQRVKSSSRKLIAEALSVSEAWLETGMLTTPLNPDGTGLNGRQLAATADTPRTATVARLHVKSTPVEMIPAA